MTVEGGIYSDAAGSPGTLQAAFASQTLSANLAPSLFTMETTSPFTLSASTNYWFVLHDAPPALLWIEASVLPATPTAATGYAFLGYNRSVDSGSSWSTTVAKPLVQINVTPAGAVPEPGSLALFAGGLGALTLVRRRVRRS